MGLWRRRQERAKAAAELSEKQKANAEKKGKGKKKAEPKKAEPVAPKAKDGSDGQAKA